MDSSAKKVVIVGDGAIGKTCLLNGLIQKDEPVDWENPAYIPTAADNQSVEWAFEAENGNIEDYDIEIWDTAGQEALQNLRQMSYPDTDIFMIGFDMTKSSSLENITGLTDDKVKTVTPEHFNNPTEDDSAWMAEIKRNCESDFRIVLLGTKSDLWEEWKEDPAHEDDCVTWEQGYDVAKAIGAAAYICTSAKTLQGVVQVGDEATRGGEPDTRLVPEGMYLKDTILWLCHAIRQSEPTPLPEPVKEEVKPPTPKPAPVPAVPAESTPAPAESTPAPASKPATENPTAPEAKPDSKPAEAKPSTTTTTTGGGDKDGGCCTLL